MKYPNMKITIFVQYSNIFTPTLPYLFPTQYFINLFNYATFRGHLANWCSIKFNVRFSLVTSVKHRISHEFPLLENTVEVLQA